MGENSSSSKVRTVEAGETASMIGASTADECPSELCLNLGHAAPGGYAAGLGELGTLLERQWRVQIVRAVSFSLRMKKAAHQAGKRLVLHYASSAAGFCWH